MESCSYVRWARIHECEYRATRYYGEEVEHAVHHHRCVISLEFSTHYHLNSSPLRRAVVLTTIWVELMADPKLFSPRFVGTRDYKLIAAGCLFLGGFSGRALVDSIGASGALGVGTGVRLLIAFGWIFVPGKPISR
jgi:Protein of unknown function (DUF1275)